MLALLATELATEGSGWVNNLLTSIPPLLVYVLIALVIGIESMGIPFPGEIMLVSAALLSSRHEVAVSPWGVAIAAIIGAVVGDSIGFWVGRKYGRRLFGFLERKFPTHVNSDLIDYAEHVFAKYGVIAVFAGRFVALLRIFAGPLSGMLKLHYNRFLAANVTGAICWAGGTTWAVYSLGVVAEKRLKDFSYVGLGIALVFGLLASTVLRRKIHQQVHDYIAQRNTVPDHTDIGEYSA